MPFLSTHRKVIAYIHIGFQNASFAIWEIREGSGVSNSSVTRVIKKLVDLKLVRHREHGYRGRNYEVTKAWSTDVMTVINTYEYAKALGL